MQSSLPSYHSARPDAWVPATGAAVVDGDVLSTTLPDGSVAIGRVILADDACCLAYFFRQQFGVRPNPAVARALWLEDCMTAAFVLLPVTEAASDLWHAPGASDDIARWPVIEFETHPETGPSRAVRVERIGGVLRLRTGSPVPVREQSVRPDTVFCGANALPEVLATVSRGERVDCDQPLIRRLEKIGALYDRALVLT